MRFNGLQPPCHKSPGSAQVCFPVSSDGPEEWSQRDERESGIHALQRPPHQARKMTSVTKLRRNLGCDDGDTCLRCLLWRRDCASSLKSHAVSFSYLAMTWMNENLHGLLEGFSFITLRLKALNCWWFLIWLITNYFFVYKESENIIYNKNAKFRYRMIPKICFPNALMVFEICFDVFGKTYKCHTASCSF